jgi:hypothetical protein
MELNLSGRRVLLHCLCIRTWNMGHYIYRFYKVKEFNNLECYRGRMARIEKSEIK